MAENMKKFRLRFEKNSLGVPSLLKSSTPMSTEYLIKVDKSKLNLAGRKKELGSFLISHIEFVIEKTKNGEITIKPAVRYFSGKHWAFKEIPVVKPGTLFIYDKESNSYYDWTDTILYQDLRNIRAEYASTRFDTMSYDELNMILESAGITAIKSYKELSKEQIFEIARYFSKIKTALVEGKIYRSDVKNFLDQFQNYENYLEDSWYFFEDTVGAFRYPFAAREALALTMGN